MAGTADGEGSDGAPYLVVAAAVLAALVLLLGTIALLSGDDGPPPEEVVGDLADEWFTAWSEDDVDAMAQLTGRSVEELAPAVRSFAEAVGDSPEVEAELPVVAGDQATVAFDVALDVRDVGPLQYEAELPFVEVDGDWLVDWSPAVLHPALGADGSLSRHAVPTTSGDVVDAGGAPLGGPLASLVRNAVEPRMAGQEGIELRAGDTVLLRRDPVRGETVRTSLEPQVEALALAALEGIDKPAAVVVLQASTGAVRAAVSLPVGGFPRAIAGRYPPGSTFKIVTTDALLTSGVTTEQIVSCPPEAEIGGRKFRNAEGESLGDVPFRQAFAKSCNTAFVQLAATLEPAALLQAAERFGFNRDPSLVVPAGVPSFPQSSGAIDHVSAAIGQGRVLVTPVHLASVAAAVASGGWRPATIVQAPLAPPTPLPTAPVLQELMRRVVAEGTATAARVPGPVPVAGKTGTAEFGTERPPRTHAWFVGFRGDVAVAVIVEDAGFGGEVAAPIAARLFRALG